MQLKVFECDWSLTLQMSHTAIIHNKYRWPSPEVLKSAIN